VDVRNLVFIDEAGIHLGMVRLFARAFRGERAVDTVPRNRGNRGTNISLIGALSLDGLGQSLSWTTSKSIMPTRSAKRLKRLEHRWSSYRLTHPTYLQQSIEDLRFRAEINALLRQEAAVEIYLI
jgi:hypothetical protein